MLFTKDITVPANTLDSAPKEDIIKIAHGIITWISVLEPPGCHGMVHCTILHHEHQIAPSTLNMTMTGDTTPIEWDEFYESYQPPYELKVKLWSPGTTYPHRVTVRVAVLPRKAVMLSAITDVFKGLWSILSPTRVYTAPVEEIPGEEVPEVPEVPKVPEVPEVPAVPKVPTPVCVVGEVKCIGKDLFECIEVDNEAAWALKEENSVYCGYVSPAPTPNLAGRILEITWEYEGVIHPLSEPMPADKLIIIHFLVRNTGSPARFQVGYEFYSPIERKTISAKFVTAQLESDTEADMHSEIASGAPKTWNISWLLWADSAKVDTMTVTFRVE